MREPSSDRRRTCRGARRRAGVRANADGPPWSRFSWRGLDLRPRREGRRLEAAALRCSRKAKGAESERKDSISKDDCVDSGPELPTEYDHQYDIRWGL